MIHPFIKILHKSSFSITSAKLHLEGRTVVRSFQRANYFGPNRSNAHQSAKSYTQSTSPISRTLLLSFFKHDHTWSWAENVILSGCGILVRTTARLTNTTAEKECLFFCLSVLSELRFWVVLRLLWLINTHSFILIAKLAHTELFLPGKLHQMFV